MTPHEGTLVRLAHAAAEVSPAWSAVARNPQDIAASSASALADGVPSLADRSRDVQLGIESIHEGWLLHRGASRVFVGASPDLALLIGDWCYAHGLCAVAEHGTLEDVEQLADLVAEVSARAEEDDEALCQTWIEAIAALAH